MKLAQKPYISQLDLQIMQKVDEGKTQMEILRDLDITEEQLTQHYEWTVERIRFLSKLLPHTTESGRVEIRAVMDKLGFLPFHPGVMELETTLRVVLEKPSLLDGPQPELFLAVAEVLELSPSQTARRVRKAISDRMRFYREAETHPFLTNRVC